MKRTAKAWVYVPLYPDPYYGWHHTRTAAMDRHPCVDWNLWRRCTITYDDGKPKPRKRRKGAR